jgi:soluble lytic murein transglycosylase-like protein
MSNVPIIKVQVDDSQFKEFFELYKDYQSTLEEMPEEWKKIGGTIYDAGGKMEDFSGAAESSKDFLVIAATQAEVISREIRKASVANSVLLESLSKNTKAQKSFADESERGSLALSSMKKHAEGLSSSIFGMGKWLLKLGTIGGGLAGLGGILGSIGLRDLASSAVDTQRGARSLGMTPGQLTAFDQDFGQRYLDSSVLGSIAGAQSSFTGRVWLARAAGQGINQVAGEDPGALAGRLAIRAHDWWTNTPASMRTAEMLQSTGFTQAGFSLPMMRQLGNTDPSELRRAASQYGMDQGRFNVSDRNTDSWYGFLRQIKDAGNVIETDLKNKLVSLSGPLQHFVDVIGKDAMHLIDDIFTPANLNALEDGINGFTKYLGSSQFQQDMKDFAGLVSAIAGAMRKAARFLGIDTSSAAPAANAPSFPPSLDPNEVQRETHGFVSSSKNAARYAGMSPTLADRLAAKIQGKNPDYFWQMEKMRGLPAGLLFAQEMAESRGNIAAKSPKGAMGPFGFMPDTAAEYGLEDPYNLHDSASSASRKMGGLMRYYKGDVSKAIAAYNWGEGHLDKDIAANGSAWQSHLPAETSAYLKRVLSVMAQQKAKGINVTVQNSTSARVAVQANAAAAQ